MILIGDCGSTKIDWALVDKISKQSYSFETPGINAALMPYETIIMRLEEEMFPHIENVCDKIEEVFFYGAGCVSDKVCSDMSRALESFIPKAKVSVKSDLEGAARALSGKTAGIACILGTGSNSCLYDGAQIIDNVPPLGFILGDEGSGASLGRRFIGDLLKRQLPQELCDKFYRQYKINYLDIIERVYRKPGANVFLASFTLFINENISEISVRKIVKDEFYRFFDRNIKAYDVNMPVHFVGSVAYYFKDILIEVAKEKNYEIGKIIIKPISELVQYHLN